jgi:hypothetical protein
MPDMGLTLPLIHVIGSWTGAASNLKQAKTGTKVRWDCGVSTATPFTTDGNRACRSTANEGRKSKRFGVKSTNQPDWLSRSFDSTPEPDPTRVQNGANVTVSRMAFLTDSLSERRK